MILVALNHYSSCGVHQQTSVGTGRHVLILKPAFRIWSGYRNNRSQERDKPSRALKDSNIGFIASHEAETTVRRTHKRHLAF